MPLRDSLLQGGHESLPPSGTQHHTFPPELINGVVVMDIVYKQSYSITVNEVQVEHRETIVTERRHQVQAPKGKGKEGEKEAEHAQEGNFDGRFLTVAAIRKRYGQDLVCMCEQLTQMLKGSPLASACLPITEENFFERIMHGVTLCALANVIEPGAVNVASVKVNGKQIPGEQEGVREGDRENLNLAFAALSKLGISCGDYDPKFLQSCSLVIVGVVVQILRRSTLSRVNLQEHELLRYTFSNWNDPEAEEAMESMDSKALLCQWVNYQLANAGVENSIKLSSLPNDLADSRVYAHLLSAVSPADKRNSLWSVKDILGLSDLVLRATVVVENASKLGIRGIITPEHIAQASRFKGNQLTTEGLRNHTINCVFLYRIFASYPNIDAPKSSVAAAASETSSAKSPSNNAKDTASATLQATRLEKSAKAEGASEETLRMWLNSFGPSDPVVCLDTDLRSGSVLLQVWEAMIPGTVNWSKVKLQDVPAPKRKFTWMSNCAEVMECAKKHGLGKLNCSATDIAVGQKTNTLALVFMMMLLHIKLRRLANTGGQGGELDDATLVKWFNESISSYGATFQLKDINDAGLRNTNALGFLGERVLVNASSQSSRTVVTKTSNSRNAAEEDGGEEPPQPPESSNATDGQLWLFPSVQPVPNDKLAKYSSDAITMFEKSGIVVYASKLGPGTDVMVYRGILTALNTFYMQSH